MLVLKGRPGKSKILDAIKEKYKDSFIVIYGKGRFNVHDSYVINPNNKNIEELCSWVLQKIHKSEKIVPIVAVYTDLSENEIFNIEKMIKNLEKDGYCKYGVIMCKE